MNFELENIGTVEELIQALNFWQTVAAYLIEAKDEPVVIVYQPESEEREIYEKYAQELTNKLYLEDWNSRKVKIMEYESNEILTVEDLMELLNIGKNTAYSLLESGEVKAFRIGRMWKIPRKSVYDYINSKVSSK